mmetsp:Transcript_38338/g.81254  ORF Transcript_38338/g.81254 Transcript_38338/m.81254 type:complete len:80 (+) Transcript_38338:176-415(+)
MWCAQGQSERRNLTGASICTSRHRNDEECEITPVRLQEERPVAEHKHRRQNHLPTNTTTMTTKTTRQQAGTSCNSTNEW